MVNISGWEFRKYSSLTGETVAEYKKGESVIEAKSDGILAKLDLEFPSNEDIQSFAKIFSEAFKQHRAMRTQVLESLSMGVQNNV